MLAEKMGLSFHDQTVNKVSGYGTGSSFDKLDFQGQANKMDVLNRWKHYSKDTFYNDIFSDRELVALSDAIFGKIRV